MPNPSPATAVSGEYRVGAPRQGELALAGNTFVLFRNVLDAIAGISGIVVGRRNETANFIFAGCGVAQDARGESNGLAYCEFVRHDLSLL